MQLWVYILFLRITLLHSGKNHLWQVHLVHQSDISLDSCHTMVYRVGKPLPGYQTDEQERDIIFTSSLK